MHASKLGRLWAACMSLFVCLAVVAVSAEAMVCVENESLCPRTVVLRLSNSTTIDLGEIDVGDIACVNVSNAVEISVNGYPFVALPTGNGCVAVPTACSNEVCLVTNAPATYRIQ